MVAVLTLVVTPGIARADFLFTPYIGRTFAKDASGQEHVGYGASVGWMGAGIAGWEVDLGFVPNFFEPAGTNTLTGKNNVFDLMANAIVGIPVGGQRGGGIRPYVTGGAGLLRTNVPAIGDALDFSSNDFGINLGFGVMGFVSDHVGFRGDVRYLRSLQKDDSAPINLGLGNFDFWRWNVGVTFR
jgi:opacity protein-like surface antigen